jgi:hypothetical protein
MMMMMMMMMMYNNLPKAVFRFTSSLEGLKFCSKLER